MNIKSDPVEIARELFKTLPITSPEATETNNLRDVLSVHVARSTDSEVPGMVFVSDSQIATLRYTRLDLRSMLSSAYNISKCCIEISAALPEQKFNFAVTVPKASERITKQLLRQAIKLVYGAKVRRIKKEMQVLLLRHDKCAATPGLAPAAAIGTCSDGNAHIHSSGLRIGAFASSIEEKLNTPIVDESGLTGIYTINLEWTGGNRESLTAALKDQLGITLTPASRVMDTLKASPGAF